MKSWFSLLKYFLIRDIKARYAGSGLGILWSFILPLFQIAIYWFVFSIIFKSRPYSDVNMPYIYFLLSGFFFWASFSEGILRAGTSIIENAELVKKVPFNNMVLPITVTLSSYMHNLIGLLIFIIILAIDGLLHAGILFMLPILTLQILFSLGSGLIIASIVPYIRDLQQVMGYILQGMFFLSPIIYSIDAIPERFRIVVYMNPVSIFIESYHNTILKGTFPDPKALIVMAIISILSISVGYIVYNKLKEGFADIL